MALLRQSAVQNVREQIQIFLQEEGINELASKFGNEQFLMKLAYLSGIFSNFNQLNLRLQGKDKYLPLIWQNRSVHSSKNWRCGAGNSSKEIQSLLKI